MTITHKLPSVDDVKDTLVMLLGDEASVESLSERPDIQYVGLYLNESDTPVAAFGCDIQFMAFAGASLTMIHKEVAEEAIASGEVSEMMQANVQEIVNIGSNWFMDSNSPHVRFTTLHAIGELPENAKSLLDAEGSLAVAAEIPKYGSGHIVCLAV